jgi:hypothetical protein
MVPVPTTNWLCLLTWMGIALAIYYFAYGRLHILWTSNSEEKWSRHSSASAK